MHLLETEGLSYRFNKQEPTLDNIQLQVPEGAIYGFLGPNGAGKTTTLKLILGLLRKQSGQIRIFGQDFEKHRLDILRQIGSLIEAPSLYGQLTARENLRLYQGVYQVDNARIDEVLQLTGLDKTGNKLCRSFSLGMKQRLAIALALLPGPRLLILDEPTNGLDPAGIVEMRELLLQINRENGITMVISSHLLSEIEKLSSHTGIIHKGKLVFQGSLQELMKRQENNTRIIYQTSNNTAARFLLEKRRLFIQEEGDSLIIPLLSRKDLAAINRELVENDIDLYQVYAPSQSLENTFMNLIQQS